MEPPQAPLYSIYTAYQKWQTFRDRKLISGGQQLGDAMGDRMATEEHRSTFGVMKILYILTLMGVMGLYLSKHLELYVKQ